MAGKKSNKGTVGTTGIEIYRETKKLFDDCLILPSGASTLLTLWCMATHQKDQADVCFPILSVTSPTKGCGKSTTLEIVKELVHKPHFTASITPAAIFRVMNEENGTLILDEADTYFVGNTEMAGILNNIYQNNDAGVTRCSAEKGYKPETFSAYGPVALGMIGIPPDTVYSRSIPIRLMKKSAAEEIIRFKSKDKAIATLRHEIGNWMSKKKSALLKMDFPRLGSGDDRYDNNHEYLLAIAHLIGPEVYEEAKLSALRMMDIVEDQDFGLVLLRDLKEMAVGGETAMKTTDILRELEKLEESPWADYQRGKPITAKGLADLLRPFGIRSKTIREGEKTFKGYSFEDMADTFGRYVG